MPMGTRRVLPYMVDIEPLIAFTGNVINNRNPLGGKKLIHSAGLISYKSNPPSLHDPYKTKPLREKQNHGGKSEGRERDRR